MTISFQYEHAYAFHENLAVVKIGGKWGYIDKSGTIVIPGQFDMAKKFTNGLAAVIIENKIGYIDEKGHGIWQPTN